MQRQDALVGPSRRPWRALAAVALVAAGLAGCASAPSTLELRARTSLREPEGLAGLRVWIDDVPYSARDFQRAADDPPRIVSDVPDRGDLRIDVQVVQEGEVVSQGSLAIALVPGYEWSVDVYRQVGDPRQVCFGCVGGQGFAIASPRQNAPGEAIWVVWGGRPRASGVVY